MRSQQLLRAVNGVGDDIILEAGEKLGLLSAPEDVLQTENKEDTMHSKKRQTTRILLIAAAITAMLAATALAAGLFSTTASPVEDGSGLSGSWNGHTVTYPDTQMFLTFESGNPRHEVYFKAGWLPTPATVNETGDDGYSFYLADEGEGSVEPYCINSHNHVSINDIRFALNGKAEVVLQDEWNGLERTEITVDYSGVEYISFPTANYIMLFDPADNWMLQIAGTSDMATLEKIAENLEIRTGDLITENHEEGLDIAWFDLGRG